MKILTFPEVEEVTDLDLFVHTLAIAYAFVFVSAAILTIVINIK